MPAKKDQLVTLTVCENDIESQLIANFLNDHEIPAVVTGSFTSGFRAEAPGNVRVWVKEDRLVEAQTILVDRERQRADVLADERDSNDLANYEPKLMQFALWSWLCGELLGMIVSIVFWVAGEASTAGLIMALTISVGLIRIISRRLRSSGS
jgi:hypothetical protein